MIAVRSEKLYYLFLLIIGFFVLSSCKNKDYPLPTPLVTALTVVNATPDTINFFVNNTRQNNLSNLYSGGATGYLPVIVGTQNYEFKKAGGPNVLFTDQFTLDTSTYYSLFVGAGSAADAFLTVDNLANADTLLAHDATFTTAAVRFVNASPSVGMLDVTEDKGDTLNIKNSAFKYVSRYVLLKGGTTKELKVFLSGSTTPKIDTLLVLQSGLIYTIFTKGTLNGTGNAAFSVGLITNTP